MNRQAAFALFLIVLNAGYFITALELPTPFALGEPGPAFLPLVLSVILFLAAGKVLITELAAGRGRPREAEEEPIGLKPFVLVGLTALYIAFFEPAGYFLATAAYAFAVAALFELERGLRPARLIAISAAVSLGVTAAGYLFFVVLFNLYLPEGTW